ncbi:nucleotide exchange factor GrpE [Catenulispora yoronensis]|uniref:nucleotide exchange factor GrpE n=1 Tax=Catenulispora yoronensis TaxID=450799 RepID=UPI0031DAB9C6
MTPESQPPEPDAPPQSAEPSAPGPRAQAPVEAVSPLFDALATHRAGVVELVYQLTRVEEAHRRLTRDIVDVFDHFVEVERLAREGDPLVYHASIRTSINKLNGLLSAQRISVYGERGEIARPTTHEVIGVQYHPDAPENTVLQVHHHGISFEGRVERPASVTVSTRKTSDLQEES